jgi:predicted SprT family Zn-dependent metalloprotease
MRAFELHDWAFGFDHARRRLGACHYANRQITLSRFFVVRNGPSEIRETLLHEISQALVGRGHGHGPVWKAMARRIGCLPVRCGTAEMPRGQWRAACPSCGRAFHRHRRPRRMDGWSCRSCGRLRGRLEWRLGQDEVA